METEDQSEQKEKENKADQQVFLNYVIDRMETWQVLQSDCDSSESDSTLTKVVLCSIIASVVV